MFIGPSENRLNVSLGSGRNDEEMHRFNCRYRVV
jgi:hypothetical protein